MRHITTLAITAIAVIAALTSCSGGKSLIPGKADRFPVINQGGKTAIVAHRGYWKCEGAGFQENSIASLRMAQEAGLWGSEFDVHLTSDDVVLVNHNTDIQGKVIWDNPYSVFAAMTLRNGEHPSTLAQYLEQGKKCKTTMLVLELKAQKNLEREDVLWDKTVEALKEYGMYDPNRVVIITFSEHLCRRVAKEAPQFVNQYLNGDIAPEVLAKDGINGIDYHMKKFSEFPDWVKTAHDNGMSVNVWTVDIEDVMRSMCFLGVDQLTTNEPIVARAVLGDKEFKLAK